MYMHEPSVELDESNALTPPRSDPSPENEDPRAVFSQPSQYQMTMFYNGSQQEQQQHFNANYPYLQSSWNYQNYYGHPYYPSIHGHSSGMVQQAGHYYQQPDHSKLYGDNQGPFVNNENQPVDPLELPLQMKPRRTRTFYSTDQIFALESSFETTKYLSRTERVKLSERIKLSERQVKIWFQNRRMKQRKALSMLKNNLTPSPQPSNIEDRKDGDGEVKTEVLGNGDMERITSTIDENAEAVILSEIQNTEQAVAFEQGANYMTSRPDEVQHILNDVVSTEGNMYSMRNRLY